MLWSWGARPPYCSGAPRRAAPVRGPRAAPARWCGLAHRPRPLREQAAGGAGARGVQDQLRPPPLRRSPFGARGGVPSALGGRRVGAPAALKPGGERGAGAAPPPPVPPPRRVSACHPLSLARLRGVYSCCGGCRAAVGVRRGANWSVRWGGGREGKVISSPWFVPPPSPGGPLKGPLRLRRPGRRRSAVGR